MAINGQAESSTMAQSRQLLEHQTTATVTSPPSVLPQVNKRGRGRPRKQPVDDNSFAVPANMIASTSKLPSPKKPPKVTVKVIRPSRKVKETIQTNASNDTTLDPNGTQKPVGKLDKGKQRMREDEVFIQTSMDTSGDIEQPEASISLLAAGRDTKGKKRGREDDVGDESPKKRGRKSLNLGDGVDAVSAKKGLVAKPSATKPNGKGLVVIRTVKWKALQPAPQPAEIQGQKSSTRLSVKTTPLRPRIWTNNRKELFAMMPEMAGSTCVNGVSWKLYETPMVLLDEHNPCFQIDRSGKDPLTLDIVTTRAFNCPIPGEADMEKSKFFVNGSPPRAFEEPTFMEGQSSEKRARRRAPRYKSPKPNKRAGAYASISQPTAAASDEIPAITFHFDPNSFVGSIPEASYRSENGVIGDWSIPSTLRLEPIAASNSSAELLPSQSIPGHTPHDVLSRSTSSQHYVLPELPNRNLTPKDSGMVDQFLIMAMKIADKGKYQPQTSSSGMNVHQDVVADSPAMPTASSELHNWDLDGLYQIVHSPSQEIRGTDSMLTMAGSPSARPQLFEHKSQFTTASSAKFDSEERFRVPPYEFPSKGSPMFFGNPFNKVEGNVPRNIPREELAFDLDQYSTPTEHLRSGDIHASIHQPPEFQTIKVDEDFDHMVLMNSEDLTAFSAAPKVDDPPAADGQDRFLAHVPSPIPEELQAIIDSYLFGRPLTIIISNAYLQNHWSLKLPDEFGYAMLGYFRILGVQETRLPVGDMLTGSMKQPEESLLGQVQWRFHLKWAPGGEENILPGGHDVDIKHSWWSSPSPSPPWAPEELPKDKIPSPTSDKVQGDADEPEDAFPTTARYRDARKRHHEYKFRHCALEEVYQSVIPLHLLVPFGPNYLDSSFPRGWLCADCGRMNFQAALRHRSCPSSFCKGKPPPVAAYAQELFFLRDPQEQLPLSAPLNTFSEALATTSVEKFENGMQTFSYHLVDDSNIFMEHIFTSNVPLLQDVASNLLRDIQLNVPLLRPLNENSPYFLWEAKSPRSNTSPTDRDWTKIPPCMNEAKKFLASRIRSFSGLEDKQFSINRLKILGWITAGSRKGADLIHAKTKSVIFCALGCTVVLVVTPRSLKGAIMADKPQDAESSQLPETVPETEVGDPSEDTASGWIADNPEADDVVEESMASPMKGKTVAKAAKPSLTIMLMHGDIFVLYGDEFEYSVKRDGTSLLLIASHDSI